MCGRETIRVVRGGSFWVLHKLIWLPLWGCVFLPLLPPHYSMNIQYITFPRPNEKWHIKEWFSFHSSHCLSTAVLRHLRPVLLCFVPLWLTGLLLLLSASFFSFMLSHHAPGCAWSFDYSVAHLCLDCDALWQKINISPLVWYGDKAVIILMLWLSFSPVIEVRDVLHWYHCCFWSLLLHTKELKFMRNSPKVPKFSLP